MKTSNFRIVALRTEVAEAARARARTGEPDHVVVTTDSPETYPCRHCLRWAEPGERMILFPFVSIAAGRPYSESGPIFVHADSCEQYSAVHEYPSAFKNGRVVRAYNSQDDMTAAEVPNGEGVEAVIERFLQSAETAFVHVRSVSRGCYTMKVERL